MSQITVKKLYESINALATSIGTVIKGVKVDVGTKASLTTNEKGSLVGAINELKSDISTKSNFTLEDAKTNLIKDTTKASDSTYSSNKIEDLITTAKADVKNSILDGAEDAYDTLKEVQNEIKKDKTAAASMLESINKRLRTDAKMELTEEQQGYIAESLGFTEANFVETFENALNS